MGWPNWKMLEARSRLKQVIRDFFCDYLEVDTPVVVPCPGVETHLRYFPTSFHDHRQSRSLWLRSSSELACKRLMAAGCHKLFELGPCFRAGAGEISPWHHPEFWMLEWYRRPCSLQNMIHETTALIEHCFQQCSERSRLSFVHLSVYECFREFVGVDLKDQDEELPAKLEAAGVFSITKDDDFDSAFFKAMLEVCEPKFKQMGAVVLSEYPPSMGVLAQHKQGRALRAEIYIDGVELTNSCMEIVSQAAHLEVEKQSIQKRTEYGYECPPLDSHFLECTDDLREDIAGTACGFERLLALCHQQSTLATALPFREIYL